MDVEEADSIPPQAMAATGVGQSIADILEDEPKQIMPLETGEVIIVDTKNKLYLISSEGEVMIRGANASYGFTALEGIVFTCDSTHRPKAYNIATGAAYSETPFVEGLDTVEFITPSDTPCLTESGESITKDNIDAYIETLLASNYNGTSMSEEDIKAVFSGIGSSTQLKSIHIYQRKGEFIDPVVETVQKELNGEAHRVVVHQYSDVNELIREIEDSKNNIVDINGLTKEERVTLSNNLNNNEKLRQNTRFIAIRSTKRDERLNAEVMADYLRNKCIIMTLARVITKKDVKEQTGIYRILEYYIRTNTPDGFNIDKFVSLLITGLGADAAWGTMRAYFTEIVYYILSYKPVRPEDASDKQIAVTKLAISA